MKAYIIFRDRVTYGRRCFLSMMVAGLEPVVVDHGSTWQPATEWLQHLEADGYTVLRRGGGHPRGLWGWQPFWNMAVEAGERYVVTDPDVVPSEGCPVDWPDHLSWLLDKYPAGIKAGLGLRTDNLPDHYARKQQVIEWEGRFWNHEIGDGAYRAGIDTTLAMYRAGAGFDLDGALRTSMPYMADHLAWHENLDELNLEQQYYYEHAERGISHWAPRGKSAWND